MKKRLRENLRILFLLCSPLSAFAQQNTTKHHPTNAGLPDSSKVYTYVERMPELPTGGGMSALIYAFQRNIKVPKIEGMPSWERTLVFFTVGPSGVIYGEKIVKSSSVPAYDQATLRAVRALPRLKPGYQNGKPVSVSFTIPVSIRIQ